MKKIRLKKKKKKHIFTKITTVLILVIMASFLLIKYFSNKASPILLSYAESETRKLTTLIINKAVTKQIANNMDMNSLFEVVKNNDNDIQLVTFNSLNVTKILNTVTDLVQLNLKAIEEGNIDLLELPEDTLSDYPKDKLQQGIIYEIPMGVITNNPMLSNIGPRIPVKLHLIGDVVTGIKSKVSEYGINNALLEVGIEIKVTSRINLPLISKEVNVSTTIPLAIKLIQGNIPNMYLDNIKNSSNIVEKSN